MTTPVNIQAGYVDADGANQAVSVSPATGSQSHVAAVTEAALNAAGITVSDLVWVDGSPAWLVSAIATHLSIPVGTPDDWWSVAA